MNAIPADTVPDLGLTLLKTFGMLCVVLGLLVAVLWLIRRFYHRGVAGRPDLIQVLASSYVGPKERIVLVDVLGEKFLVGITGQHINLLSKITNDEAVCSPPPEAGQGHFKSLLKRRLKNAPDNSAVEK